MRAWLFPGQGSQRKGMGEGLFDLFPGLCAEVDAILGYSIRDLCLKDPDGRLRQTQYAQPALFVVNALTHLARLREEPEPDFYAGHSLGEFDALFAAGCFDLATGVRLVRRRGELMGRADGGVMTAVLGLPAATVAALLEEAGVADVDVANHNSADQVVLSGAPEGMARAVEAVERAGGFAACRSTSAPPSTRGTCDRRPRSLRRSYARWSSRLLGCRSWPTSPPGRTRGTGWRTCLPGRSPVRSAGGTA